MTILNHPRDVKVTMALLEQLCFDLVFGGTVDRPDKLRIHFSRHGDLSGHGKDCPPHHFIEDSCYYAAVCHIVIPLKLRIKHKVGKDGPILELNQHLEAVSMGTTEKTVGIAGQATHVNLPRGG